MKLIKTILLCLISFFQMQNVYCSSIQTLTKCNQKIERFICKTDLACSKEKERKKKYLHLSICLFNLSELQMYNEDYLRSLKNLSKAEKLNKGEIEPKLINFTLCLLYSNLREEDKGMLICKNLVDENPNWAGGYYGLGLMLYQNKKWSGAKNYLERSVELDPSVDGYQILTTINYKLTKYMEALFSYEKAMNLNISSTLQDKLSTFIAIQSAIKIGDTTLAKRLLAMAIARNPKWKELSNYQIILRNIKNMDAYLAKHPEIKHPN